MADATLDEIRQILKDLSEAQARTQVAQAKNEFEIDKFLASIKAVHQEMGGISNSQGEVAEAYFFNSLTANPVVGDVQYERVYGNRRVVSRSLGKVFEYDMLLVNGKSIAVIETKYKASKQALTQLTRAVENVREAMPEYKDHAVYGGIASLSISEALIKEAHEKGFFVLQRKGDVFAVDAQAMRAF
jgi:hypothetical protein